MRVGSLFSGIGGLDLGLEWAGMEIVWQSEIDPYANAVLRKHWPNVPNIGDIKAIDPANLPPVDLVCGGYPCQPFSLAGRRQGQNDDRHLWPYMRQVVAALRPSWVLCENVAGHVTMGLDVVLSDLENLGYAVQPLIIPACAVDAKHRRDRVWILANPDQLYGNGSCASVADTNSQSAGRIAESREEHCQWLFEPGVGRVAHGIPRRVDRLKALGNAVVPQVAYEIGRAIMAAHHTTINPA